VNDFTPLQTPYEGSRAAFHSLIIGRIYHEDMLFAQRSYILLGVHAFLLTAFTVLVTGKVSPLTWPTAISLTLFGALLGIFQASFGRQTSRAIGFWREYARLIEENWQIAFDHLQYDFYAVAKAETPFGVITKKEDRQRALYQLFKRTRYLTSITAVVGLFFPAGLAIFWALGLGYILQLLTNHSWVSITAFSIVLLLEIAVLRPSLAEPKSLVSRVGAITD